MAWSGFLIDVPWHKSVMTKGILCDVLSFLLWKFPGFVEFINARLINTMQYCHLHPFPNSFAHSFHFYRNQGKFIIQISTGLDPIIPRNALTFSIPFLQTMWCWWSPKMTGDLVYRNITLWVLQCTSHLLFTHCMSAGFNGIIFIKINISSIAA